MTKDIEQLVRELPLQQPSAQLDERVLALGRGSPWKRLGLWGALAAMVLLAATVGYELAREPHPEAWTHRTVPGLMPTPTSGSTALAAQNVHIDQATYQLLESGFVLDDDQTPLQLIHSQTLVQSRWIDAQTQASVEITSPREELVLVRAQMQ